MAKLKDDLKKIEGFFPRSHPVFQLRSANIDEVHVRFCASPVATFDIHCNLPENFPKSAPLWSSESDNAQITGLLETLSNTTGQQNHIFPQVTSMLTSLCSLFGVELPAEVELLKVVYENEYAAVGGDAEPEYESMEDPNEMMDADGDDDDYPVEMSAQSIYSNHDKMDAQEDEGIDEQGQAALERVKKANLERHSLGTSGGAPSAPHGTVQASDRLMKELKHIYKSDNYKNQLFSVELVNDSLYDWMVKIYKVDPDSALHKDMVEMNKKLKIDHLCISMKFPDSFPFSPPFVRIINPVISGGYVLTGGAICMELLTKGGWSSAYTVEAVVLQIAATLVKGRARINFQLQPTQAYSQSRAEESFRHLVKIHDKGGWFTPPKSDG
ncbi:Ubiquitin-conjugating enzyme E2 Q2 [Hypsibius exemplaris]|uniref:E2 ubiquitin-conjugating enzyme n=1 Tax=Hypsibius exemplaris TaxID=2072580 RepID=A0A1W0XAB1_HYPEX|nr:Ubiquitin-conjugating enzyme E2 Q2 [Hypsibius exemplaris]